MVSLGTQPANRKSGFGHSSPTGARAQDLSRHPHARFEWGSYLQPCCFSARPRVGSTTSDVSPADKCFVGVCEQIGEQLMQL